MHTCLIFGIIYHNYQSYVYNEIKYGQIKLLRDGKNLPPAKETLQNL